MRHFTFILITSLLVISCGQNDTTQKEPALKEREISLKEKEFALQQKDSSTTPNVKTDPATQVSATTALTVSPLNIDGDLGQVTFSQKEQTIFYYNLKSKKGKIRLNGVDYILNKYAFNSSAGSYTLSGEQVTIVAPNCKFKESKGGDCGYGKFAVVTIKLGTDILILNKVEVQDCPDY